MVETEAVAAVEEPANPGLPYDPDFQVPEFRPAQVEAPTEVGSAAVIEYVGETVPEEELPDDAMSGAKSDSQNQPDDRAAEDSTE